MKIKYGIIAVITVAAILCGCDRSHNPTEQDGFKRIEITTYINNKEQTVIAIEGTCEVSTRDYDQYVDVNCLVGKNQFHHVKVQGWSQAIHITSRDLDENSHDSPYFYQVTTTNY